MNNQIKKELGEDIHNQVIGWTENCDTKASIMIAFIGIFASILFTSDYILDTLQKIVSYIFIYWQTGKGEFSTVNLLVILALMASLFFIGWTILLLFKVLAGKTSCNQDSIFFFSKIQDQPFDEYYKKVNEINEEALMKDRYRQIYNCSKRCTEKFRHYNKAILMAKHGLICLCFFMIFTIISNV